jgi:hypothetical protein
MRIVIGGSTKAEKLSPANMSHSLNALKLQTITHVVSTRLTTKYERSGSVGLKIVILVFLSWLTHYRKWANVFELAL